MQWPRSGVKIRFSKEKRLTTQSRPDNPENADNEHIKMKAIHIRRLRKLIAFLRTLPRKRFNFAIVRNEPPKCGAVGCAIGYTPNVFPRVLESVRVYARPWTHGVRFRGKEYADFEAVAQWLTGLSDLDAGCLFEAGGQSLVDDHLKDLSTTATPKQVAAMLEKFIKLQTSK